MQLLSSFLCLSFIILPTWLGLGLGLAQITNNITTDQHALLAFKDHVNSSILASNWSITSSVCEWIGVTCSLRHHRVTALDLSRMNLSSTIPPQLGNLSLLVSLNLSVNGFYGELPSELSRLRRLRVLEVGTNHLEGEIPSWIGSLHDLQIMSFYNNSLVGTIPLSISNLTKLEQLWLSYNYLNGSIPQAIGVPHLRTLVIENNQISGPIPYGLFNISSLEDIALQENNMFGSLPVSICNQPHMKLQYVSLGFNQFSGHIPPSLGQCSELRFLSLSDNKFGGLVPKDIGSLMMLGELYLDKNNLGGEFPREIGNLTELRNLDVSDNMFSGTWSCLPKVPNGIFDHLHYCAIPKELANLYNLQAVDFGHNKLTGHIPVTIFNLSTLNVLSFGDNKLFGKIPSNMCLGLPNLQKLFLFNNSFDGTFPQSISNCSNLKTIEVGMNKFVGSIPNSLGNLRLLEYLNLADNCFSTDGSSFELTFMTSLTNCNRLRSLQFTDNHQLNGELPKSFGNLSASLEMFAAGNCAIKGEIPLGLGNLSRLTLLDLSSNQLRGSIPENFEKLDTLQSLELKDNQLKGAMLNKLCCLSNLVILSLSQNQISESITACLGNVTSLRNLYLDSNRLTSTLPDFLFNLKDILFLNLSSNHLVGSLSPLVGNFKAAIKLDFSMNNFSSIIPSTIGGLQTLSYLSLALNNFQGSIPEIKDMLSLETLELSHNNLSGFIPSSLEKLQYLKYMNVSFNKLRGQIPSKGPFENFTYQSFMYNDDLCGPPRFLVPSCSNMSRKGSRRRNHHLLRIISICVGITATFGFMALVLVYMRYRKKKYCSSRDGLPLLGEQERVSYFELQKATNGYSEENLLGKGAFGSVYLGTLKDGRTVAIKVFNPDSERAFKSFDVECQVLRNLRHRNLNKVISSCSAPDFKALVLEFMPNGSLDECLYSNNQTLDMDQRLSIMIDVATALQYLHSGYSTPVVHCDMKPSNVLLDQEMVAHVSDFGITKILSSEDSCTHTKTIATFGYVAPEYGSEGLVTTSCDVYSFGIMLMEVFVRLRPTDERFNENFSLKDMVGNAIPDALSHVVDASLFEDGEEEYQAEMLECVSSIMQIALCCSRESPGDRCEITQVVNALTNVKSKLLKNRPRRLARVYVV